MSYSKFAQDQLAKRGWVDGAGLGREEQGRLYPIKVARKNNKKGVGNDPSKEFTNNWWDQMFNKAASSISVDNHENGVDVKTVVTEDKQEAKKSLLYGNFIQTSTLTNSTNGCEEVRHEEETPEVEDILKSKKYTVTDEEMFRKCGGRTAHKGARHGLTLNGKLKRIEEHEAQLMAEINRKREEKEKITTQDKVTGVKSKKKKKKKSRERESTDEVSDAEATIPDVSDDEMAKSGLKRKRSKKQAEEEELNDCDTNIEVTNSNSSSKKVKKDKKRKKREKESQIIADNDSVNLDNDNINSLNGNTKQISDCDEMDNIADELNTESTKKKKKKKKKKKYLDR